jgi:signal transduction histidine kinase
VRDQVEREVERRDRADDAGRQRQHEDDEQGALGQVLAETRRGSALIRQLLAVGACESIQPEPMDLNEFIQGQQCVLRRLVGDRINLIFEPTKSLPPVLADVRALGHILVNLVLNARDALTECGCSHRGGKSKSNPKQRRMHVGLPSTHQDHYGTTSATRLRAN